MSWRKNRLTANAGSSAQARFHFRSTRILRGAFLGAFCSALLVANSLCNSQLAAQENPLREADAGYLQQLLPSLQRIQSEASAGSDSRGATSEQFNPQPLPAQPGGNEFAGNQSQAGLWRPDPASQSPATPASQTEARLADKRALAPWPEAGDAPETSNPPSIPKSTPKSAAAVSTGSSLSKGSTARTEGAGKLAAFKGIESLKLDSTVVKIGLNTLLVLAASIGLIVVVRRSLPRQAQAAKSPAGKLRVEQTLGLGGKAELKVVRCGLHQVLVAIDNGGIKSVVALEPSLEAERENLEPAAAAAAVNQPPAGLKEPVNIEQFVKMIRDMEGDLMSARPGR